MYRDKNGTKSQNLARRHDNKYLKNADELSGRDMEGRGDRTPSSTPADAPGTIRGRFRFSTLANCWISGN